MTPSEMSTDKRLEILYAHYNDVVGDRRNRIRYRNRYLFLILVVIVLLLVQGMHPKFVFNILVGVAARFSGATPPEDTLILEPILLFAYMLVVLRYLQISVGIERSYGETKFLEKQLQCAFSVPIRIEGDGYGKNYPPILNWFDHLYKFVIPIGLLLIATLSIMNNLPAVPEIANPVDLLTILFAGIVIVFVALFLWFSYSGTVKRGLAKIGLIQKLPKG